MGRPRTTHVLRTEMTPDPFLGSAGQMFVELAALFPVMLFMVLTAIEFSSWYTMNQRVARITNEIGNAAKRVDIKSEADSDSEIAAWMNTFRTQIDSLIDLEFGAADRKDKPVYVITLWRGSESNLIRKNCIRTACTSADTLIGRCTVPGEMTARSDPADPALSCMTNITTVTRWADYQVDLQFLSSVRDEIITVEMYSNYEPVTPLVSVFASGPGSQNANSGNGPEIYYTSIF